MDVKQVLHELIAMPEQAHPVASVYLDVRRNDEHAREAVRVFVRDGGRRALKAEADDVRRQGLERTVARVEAYVAGLLRQQTDRLASGVAVFACEPAGLFRVVVGRLPFLPMAFLLDDRPRVAPFLRALSLSPPLLLAAVDSTGARLWEMNFGLLDIDARVERPFPGWHSQGGWSQRNFQQHLRVIRDRNLKASAEPFARMAEALPDAALVVAGQHHLLKAFEEHLPCRVRARIVARPAFPGGLGETALLASVLEQAEPHLENALRSRIIAERDRAVAEAARGGLGAVGAREVLAALAEGGVRQVLIDADLSGRGGACRRCGALFAGDGAVCDGCGGELRSADFAEEVARRAVRSDAEVVFLPRENPVPGGHGLAAVLRHRGAARAARTGLAAGDQPAR